MQFTVDTDTGRITVDAWEDDVTWSLDLLSRASTEYLRVEGDCIYVRVDNGTACYKIVMRDEKRRIAYSRLTDFQGLWRSR